MAPELLNKDTPYCKAVDMWNVGIIMYELMTNCHPLLSKEDDKYSYK